MKTLFRVLSLAILLTAFSALSFAQTSEQLAADYAKYKTEKAKPCGERDDAVALGKSIVEKNENVAEVMQDNAAVVNFVKKDYPAIEKDDARCKLNKRYDTAYKAKNWSEFMDVSKQLIAMEGDTPLGLDILLTHVSAGYDRAVVDNIDTYNAETVNYAKTALQRLEANKPSQTKKYGVFVPFGTKEAAQSWMNYIIGWEMYNKLNQKNTDALGYLYKSTTISNEKKNDPSIYTTIGSYYFDEAVKLDTKYREARAANNNQDTDETKSTLALARGTADRAADAFGRAYKIASADPKYAQLKTGVAKTLTDLYKFRFNLADAKQADVDKYIADLVAKPMPDPTSAITPVVEETKPTTATTSTTNTTTPTNTSATTNKTSNMNTKETTTATTTKPTPAKKPLPKKKGTR